MKTKTKTHKRDSQQKRRNSDTYGWSKQSSMVLFIYFSISIYVCLYTLHICYFSECMYTELYITIRKGKTCIVNTAYSEEEISRKPTNIINSVYHGRTENVRAIETTNLPTKNTIMFGFQ